MSKSQKPAKNNILAGDISFELPNEQPELAKDLQGSFNVSSPEKHAKLTPEPEKQESTRAETGKNGSQFMVDEPFESDTAPSRVANAELAGDANVFDSLGTPSSQFFSDRVDPRGTVVYDKKDIEYARMVINLLRNNMLPEHVMQELYEAVSTKVVDTQRLTDVRTVYARSLTTLEKIRDRIIDERSGMLLDQTKITEARQLLLAINSTVDAYNKADEKVSTERMMQSLMEATTATLETLQDMLDPALRAVLSELTMGEDVKKKILSSTEVVTRQVSKNFVDELLNHLEEDSGGSEV